MICQLLLLAFDCGRAVYEAVCKFSTWPLAWPSACSMATRETTYKAVCIFVRIQRSSMCSSLLLTTVTTLRETDSTHFRPV